MDDYCSDLGVDSAEQIERQAARVYEVQVKELKAAKRVLAASGVKDGH